MGDLLEGEFNWPAVGNLIHRYEGCYDNIRHSNVFRPFRHVRKNRWTSTVVIIVL